MCYYIGIQDLVANALIELAKKGIDEVSFKRLNAYGARVIEKLNENKERAVLVLSRDYTNRFIHDCTEYFEVKPGEDGDLICLKKGIDPDALEDVFRLYTDYKVLQAFVDSRSLEALGI